MILHIISLICLWCFCKSEAAYAFLPPEFFVRGLASIWTVIASGIAVAIIPFVLGAYFAKEFIKKHRKIILYIVFQNVIIAVLLGVFFYCRYYKPLYDDSYLFPKKHKNETKGEDPARFNQDYIVLDGIFKDRRKRATDYKFGLTAAQIRDKIDRGEKIYFIDVREIEEYNAGHIIGAKHIRWRDLAEKADSLKDFFSLTPEEFSGSLFVLYCHDGDRASLAVQTFNNDKIKYLIGGTEAIYNLDWMKHTGSLLSDKAIFGKQYQYKFQTRAEEAIKIIKEKNAFVIDLRHPPLFAKKHIKESFPFKFSLLTQAEYEEGLKKILANKEKETILIADRYSELFYANLLILRLLRDYDFDKNQFHIVFSQFEVFKDGTDIHLEGEETGPTQNFKDG